jgi:phosphatidylserine/phosphatidylglycerophosphate/cardiolipin synthase-like enzyme
MSSFSSPFDPSVVSRITTDKIIKLPDPTRKPNDHLVRPGIARYAGTMVVMMHIMPAAAISLQQFGLSWPVTGTVRNIDLTLDTSNDIGIDKLKKSGINKLLEISPLPFAIAPVLRSLKPGFPTFYLGYVPAQGCQQYPKDDDLVKVSSIGGPPNIGYVSEACLGMLFQDRVSLAPWAWIKLIHDAMITSKDINGAENWNKLKSLYDNNLCSLRVVDHIGCPAAGRTFQFKIHKANGTVEGPWECQTGEDGDLEIATFKKKPTSPSGVIAASLFGEEDDMTELEWKGDNPLGDNLPVQTIYESCLSNPKSGLSTPPSKSIILPSEFKRAHLQILDLARWFAPRPLSSNLARYQIDSRVEPLIDGVDTFRRMVEDLKASASPGNGAHFAGWAFKDFPLIDGQDDTKITALTQSIINGGGNVRFLVWKVLNYKKDPASDSGIPLAVVILLTSALRVADFINWMKTDGVGFMLLLGGTCLTPLWGPKLLNWLKDKGEQNKDIHQALNNIQNGIALWARYPARIIDNPIATTTLTPLKLEQYIDQFGSWHQKIQLIKRKADGDGNQFIAYLGGIDINDDRLDTTGHQTLNPFHDVHARITGPGAADIFRAWDERYTYHNAEETGTLLPAFVPPDANALPVQTAKHITQVGLTYFKPDPIGGTNPFPFAPGGECTTNETLIKAIGAAREFIYIEEQYFTPNDSSSGKKTFFNALLEARNHCRRLLIVVPSEIDQPFGDSRRRYLFDLLQKPEPDGGWGDRVLIGSPLRRPILPNPGRICSEGRCILMQKVNPQDGLLKLGPPARVPESVPFWLWIDGELMLSSSKPKPTKTNDGRPCIEIDVLRGPDWGGTAHGHQEGAAVTISQLKGIYVHSKIMIVDDVFVSIGSANLNRRGLLHDGEINIFAVPERLKASADNPARALRTALWAEQLGLPPSMGSALFGDPIAAFDLFRRSRYEGNRFTTFNALNVNYYLTIPGTDGLVLQILEYIVIPTLVNPMIPTIWNTVTDPTTNLDPDPTEGPSPSP